MRMDDCKRSVNAEAKRVPHDFTRSIRNPDDANREQACLLLQGQFEVIEDQLDGGAQGIVLVALLQEGGLHLVELLL